MNAAYSLYNTVSTSFLSKWDIVTGAVRFLSFNAICWLKGDHLPNFSQVSDKFYRGGQPDLEGIKILERQGITQILCLRVVDANTSLIKAAKVDITTTLLKFDVDNFNQEEAQAAAKFLVRKAKDSNETFFLHCYYGCERTGVLAAVYRMAILDHPKETVIGELKADPNFHKERHPQLIPFLEGLNIERLKDYDL